jgi:hypothetical protein
MNQMYQMIDDDGYGVYDDCLDDPTTNGPTPLTECYENSKKIREQLENANNMEVTIF